MKRRFCQHLSQRVLKRRANGRQAATGLVFAGFIIWIFCFGMSRYSGFMERHLDTGHKR